MTTFVLLCTVLILPAVISGCGGGGGGGGGGPAEVTITMTNCDATTYAQYGVICIDFTATGPAGVFDLLAQYIGGTSGPLVGAYEVPPGLAALLAINPPSNSQNLVISSNGGTVTGRFCWFAGADLGFIGALGIQFFLTPVADNSQTPVGPIASGCPSMNYLGGGQTVVTSGPGIGANGRAAHCAENVSDKSIAIAGGYNGTAGVFSSFDTADRFTFDVANFTYSKNANALIMRSPRTDHACSFFLDPNTETIKVLVTGGANFGTGVNSLATNTADVYCFSPQPDSIVSTASNMNVARRGHTATWVASNKVVLIGGETGGPVNPLTLGSIEIYDPVFDTFTPVAGGLINPRRGHTATLLPNGKILVAGGFALAAPTTPLPAELFDPNSQSSMLVAASLVDRVHHTATRLANGWVLLAGGLNVSTGAHSSSADIFEPELGAPGSMGAFTLTMPLMTTPRAYHAASLLGTGDALVSGGETGVGPVVTPSSEVFLPQTLTFTPTIPMQVARAEHSSTGTSCGPIVLIGGRNQMGATTTFLGTVEMYAYDNMNPVVASAFTATSPLAGTVFVDMTITDADADGGYVIIRFRPLGMGMYRLATIDQQNPSTAGGGFPNMQVGGMPNQALPYAFRWNFAADGLSSGQTVEVEIIPIGVTLGTPVNLPLFQLP